MSSSRPLNLAIIGCGDFLRWQAPALKASKRVRVRTLFDLDATRAAKFAAEFGAAVAPSLDALYADGSIDAVALFVPPWVRREAIERAVSAKKHILTTKPLAPDTATCAAIVRTVAASGLRAGVIYGRTGDAFFNHTKLLLDRGTFGRLALYKQDWIHHYPAWNTWALDPAKNGGPFMDAMIHNLNAARFLMGRPATHATYFSDNHAHPDLPCRDTEFMKLDFEGRGSAHLFITWAADLAVYSLDGNDREHHDSFYLVTDQGWRITRATHDGRPALQVSREGETRLLPLPAAAATHFDAFAEAVATGGALPGDLIDFRMAAEDIALIRHAETRLGQCHPVQLNLPPG